MQKIEDENTCIFKHLLFGKEYTVTVYFNEDMFNASFDFRTKTLKIPATDYYYFMLHELMEMGMVLNLCRFKGCEGSQEYLFVFNHSQFSVLIEIIAPEIKRLDEYLKSRFKVYNGNLIRKKNIQSKKTIRL